MTDRQQLVRLGKFSFRTGRSALELHRAVFSPHCSSPCTPTTAYIKTPLSSSWSLQMTPHSSASSRTVTSLLTDRRLRSWLSGAVVTTWSLTRSKLWRWSWTSGETPLLSPPLNEWSHSGSWAAPFSRTWIGTITLKKAQQRLYFLRQLKMFNLPQELLKQFYSAIIESVLCMSISVWFSSASKSDLRRLPRVVRTAERIIGTTLPTLPELYLSRVCKTAGKITLDPHIQHTLSLNCFRLVKLQSSEHQNDQNRNSFFP